MVCARTAGESECGTKRRGEEDVSEDENVVEGERERERESSREKTQSRICWEKENLQFKVNSVSC